MLMDIVSLTRPLNGRERFWGKLRKTSEKTEYSFSHLELVCLRVVQNVASVDLDMPTNQRHESKNPVCRQSDTGYSQTRHGYLLQWTVPIKPTFALASNNARIHPKNAGKDTPPRSSTNADSSSRTPCMSCLRRHSNKPAQSPPIFRSKLLGKAAANLEVMWKTHECNT